MSKTINELRKCYGLDPVELGDTVEIKSVELCNDNCANYLLIKYERLTSNNICYQCCNRDSNKINELMELNRELDKYVKEVQEVLNEV